MRDTYALPSGEATQDAGLYVRSWRLLAEWCEERWPRLKGRRVGWDPDLSWDGLSLPAWLVMDLMKESPDA